MSVGGILQSWHMWQDSALNCQCLWQAYSQVAKEDDPMAQWWTKPPIILAVLGVLAVLLPARLPRMPITQHTPGAGSGEQALQEALTTYRQLAQTQPPTHLPEVAMVRYNLGLLSRGTQRLREGEQALQEALTTYRQLAQAQPQAYLPQVAMTLHNLGIVRLDQEDLQQVQTLMTEALTIRRVMWKHRIGAEGNDMGPSLAVEIMLPQRQAEAVTLICERLHKMAQGAREEHLKQWARERAVKVCKRGR